MTDKEQAGKEFLAKRQAAYQRVFNSESVDAQIVLKDLTQFCRALTTTFHPDPRIAAQLDGRREVFLRIHEHTQLSLDQLWALLGAPPQKG